MEALATGMGIGEIMKGGAFFSNQFDIIVH
jgi:hypothetical protein